MNILNLGAKRGKKIKDKVIDKLLDLLPQSSTQIKNSITQTIAYQIPYLDYVSNLFSENLIGILGKNKDINKEYISLALEQLGMRSNVGFSKNNIKLLDGIKNEHFQITNNTQTLSDEKDLFTLLNELKTTNNNLDILALIKDNRLQDRIVSIEKAYSAGTNFFNVLTKNAPLLIGVNKESEDPIICLKEPIKFWSEEDINIWSKCFIRSSNQIENKQKAQNEIIAVIKRAIEIDSSKNYGQLHELRTVQLLSILLMLDAKSGLLAQIATGEGKSTIVSAVAVVNALQGRKVDVITSSSVLAKRDVKEKASFYNMFNLKASDNGDEGYGFKETKNCYKNDVHIIYGDAANFQFDILRHEYSALGTRGNRSFDNTVAIIDEVDSMFIDDNSKMYKSRLNLTDTIIYPI